MIKNNDVNFFSFKNAKRILRNFWESTKDLPPFFSGTCKIICNCLGHLLDFFEREECPTHCKIGVVIALCYIFISGDFISDRIFILGMIDDLIVLSGIIYTVKSKSKFSLKNFEKDS